MLLKARFGAATRAAIALTAITMLANPEDCMTSMAAANSLPEKPFSRNDDVLSQEGLDNGSRSWQVGTSIRSVVTCLRVAKPGPCRL